MDVATGAILAAAVWAGFVVPGIVRDVVRSRRRGGIGDGSVLSRLYGPPDAPRGQMAPHAGAPVDLEWVNGWRARMDLPPVTPESFREWYAGGQLPAETIYPESGNALKRMPRYVTGPDGEPVRVYVIGERETE